MPSRNVIRHFEENGIYHVFNRGVEKRDIFLDDQDYRMFLYYLFIYVTPLVKVLLKYPTLPIRLHRKNLNNKLELLVYSLMPNHFHLLIKIRRPSRGLTPIRGETPDIKKSISQLLKQLTNAYTFYFNKKYKRVGGLVQGVFKAVRIETDEQLLHISRYIHINSLVVGLIKDLKEYKWSSFLDYVGKRNGQICSKENILSFFSSSQKYEQFVMDQVGYAAMLEKFKHLNLD